jgi:hypothetical protein
MRRKSNACFFDSTTRGNYYMLRKPKSNKNTGVVVLSVDLNNEPVEIQNTNPTFGGAGGYQINWAPGVPNPNTDPEGFEAYLDAWHRKNNPHLFKNEEG